MFNKPSKSAKLFGAMYINNNSIGLYRDNCLTILKDTSDPETEKFKKKFKEKDLDIII